MAAVRIGRCLGVVTDTIQGFCFEVGANLALVDRQNLHNIPLSFPVTVHLLNNLDFWEVCCALSKAMIGKISACKNGSNKSEVHWIPLSCQTDLNAARTGNHVPSLLVTTISSKHSKRVDPRV